MSLVRSVRALWNPPSRIIAEAEAHAAAGDSTKALQTLRRLALDDFCELLLEVPAHAPALKALLPAMPGDDDQRLWTGASGRILMTTSIEFMRAVDRASRQYRGHGIGGKVLDYGCGWGRLMRMLLWYVEPAQIYGADPWDRSLAVCREYNCPGQLALCASVPTEPPFPERFDLIYAFSVFTHLSERTADAVLQVLRQALQPDGMLVITIRPREYWNAHNDWRGQQRETLLAQHDANGFAFLPLGFEAVDGEITYGDTSMTLDFIRQRWPQWKIAGTARSPRDPLQTLVFLLPA